MKAMNHEPMNHPKGTPALKAGKRSVKDSRIYNARRGDQREFTNVLNALVNYNFIEKRGKGEYAVTDPLLRQINLTPLLRKLPRVQ